MCVNIQQLVGWKCDLYGLRKGLDARRDLLVNQRIDQLRIHHAAGIDVAPAAHPFHRDQDVRNNIDIVNIAENHTDRFLDLTHALFYLTQRLSAVDSAQHHPVFLVQACWQSAWRQQLEMAALVQHLRNFIADRQLASGDVRSLARAVQRQSGFADPLLNGGQIVHNRTASDIIRFRKAADCRGLRRVEKQTQINPASPVFHGISRAQPIPAVNPAVQSAAIRIAAVQHNSLTAA